VSFRLRLALFLIGLALATGLILHVGVETLLGHLASAGWLMLPVIAIWGVAYLLHTTSWGALLRTEPEHPGFFRTFGVTLTSFALNYVTPVLGFGGEAYRAAAVAPWLGRQRSVGSVVQYRLLHSLAHMLFVLTALVPAIWLLPGTPTAISLLIMTAGIGVVVGWFLLRRHQEGILEAGLDLLLAIPGVRRLARPLAVRRPALRELDTQITTVYHQHPRTFWLALGVEYVARYVIAMELAAVFWSLGLGFRPGTAIVASALSTTIANLFFFLPLELGVREGGLFLVFGLLGIGAEHGVFAAVVTRLREFTWMLIGIGLLWVSGGRLRAEPGGVGRGAAAPGAGVELNGEG
jgi:uncharacterized protein (TIRG00374 family)